MKILCFHLTRAFSKLSNGGTIVLTQDYNVGALLELPDKDVPFMITAEHNNVIFTYKFIKIRCSLYMDNIILAPETLNGISVIECNFNNVVMGEGMSCLNRPFGENDFPYIVGGKWKYTGSDTAAVYDKFKPSDQNMSTSEEYTIKILGGTWQRIFLGSVKNNTEMNATAPNAQLTVSDSATVKIK